MQSGGLQMCVFCLVIDEFYKGGSATDGDTTSGLLLIGANKIISVILIQLMIIVLINMGNTFIVG